MVQLRSVGVLSVGRTLAILHGVLGLVVVPIFLAMAMVSAVAGRGQANGAITGGVMVVFAVMIPVFYAVFGFVMGVIMAAIYNAIASKLGGIELDLVPVAAAGVVPVNPVVSQ